MGLNPASTERPTAVAHTLKHLLQKLIPERVACDEGDLAGAFREGQDTYFFLYDDWRGGLGVSRRAFEQLDDLLRRAHVLATKTCCTSPQGCYECIAVSRCFSPLLPSGERRPTDKEATALFLQNLLGIQPAPAAEGEAIPDVAPALPGDWAQQARELLDLHGLSLPEVSARLGIPSREIQRAVSATAPLRLSHAKFGEGILTQGSGQGDAREVLVYFPGHGYKRLLVKYAGLSVAGREAAGRR